MQNIKLTVVGDSNVGKTCMLISYTTNAFPGEYIPTVFESHNTNVMVDGRPIELNLNDTNGSDDYDRLRHLNYRDTSIFLICFAVNNRNSFTNIRDKWVPELAHHCPGIPYIVCGLKCDLRNDIDLDSTDFINIDEANTLSTEIGASSYIEISSLTSINLKSVFDDAIRIVINDDRLELLIPAQVANNNNNNINNINNNNNNNIEFKCECDWKEVLNQTWQIFAFIVAVSVYILIDIWALIIAYNQYNTNNECWNDLNKLWLHPRIFLIVAGLTSIIGVGLGMIFKTFCGIDEERQDVPRLCILCFFFVWAIIGYVITGQIASIQSCHQQSIGKITIAWSIVKNIEFCCASLDIIVNAYKFHFMN